MQPREKDYDDDDDDDDDALTKQPYIHMQCLHTAALFLVAPLSSHSVVNQKLTFQ